MLDRKYQLAAKIESSEGVAETLAAADAKLLVYDPELVLGKPETFERTPSMSSHSKLGHVIGSRPGTLTHNLELRGSGTATTSPEWAKIIRSCGIKESSLKSITIGAVTSGPFQHGETITGTLSGATGRVMMNTANGTTTLYYVPVGSLEFQNGETITGGTSAATATSGSLPSSAGKAYEPSALDDITVPSLTMTGYEDGIRKLIAGARGNMQLTVEKPGKPLIMKYAHNGVYAGLADVAALSGVTHESTKPPVFLDVAFALDSYAGRIRQFELNLNNVLAAKEDGNAQYGMSAYSITDRTITGVFTIDKVLVATFDLYSKLYAATEMPIVFTLGATTGNKYKFYAPRLQITNIEEDKADGIKIAKCTYQLNGSANIADIEFCLLGL